MLVTIDDLQQLMDVLSERPEVINEVVVECDEGEFTEAEDMRKLGDRSLTDLRIGVSGLYIYLSEDRAEAVGPPELVEHVERVWARPRQTKERPSGKTGWSNYWPDHPIFLAIGVVLAILATVFNLFIVGGDGGEEQLDSLIATFRTATVILVVVAALLMGAMSYWEVSSRRPG